MDALVEFAPDGEMLSHVVVPLTPEAVAVKLIREAAVTESVWIGGGAAPAVALKVKDAGLTFSDDVVVGDVMTRVTGIAVVDPFADIRIEPL